MSMHAVDDALANVAVGLRHWTLANCIALVVSVPPSKLESACLDVLDVVRAGGVQLDDLLRVGDPCALLSAGSTAAALGLDPGVNAFIASLVGAPPDDASLRAVEAMVRFKTFEFTAMHLCSATSSAWPRPTLAAIGKHIVQQTKAGLVDGNIAAVAAVLWPERCGAGVTFPGRTFERREWCCLHHYNMFKN